MLNLAAFSCHAAVWQFLGESETGFIPDEQDDHADLEPEKALMDYRDPFNAECRAFARLEELGREDLAVRVHGYVSLPLTKEMLSNIKSAMEEDDQWTDPLSKTTMDPRQAFGRQDGPDDGSWAPRCFQNCVVDMWNDISWEE